MMWVESRPRFRSRRLPSTKECFEYSTVLYRVKPMRPVCSQGIHFGSLLGARVPYRTPKRLCHARRRGITSISRPSVEIVACGRSAADGIGFRRSRVRPGFVNNISTPSRILNVIRYRSENDPPPKSPTDAKRSILSNQGKRSVIISPGSVAEFGHR